MVAIGISGNGGQNPLGVIEAVIENPAVGQVRLDRPLFIIDRAKALPQAW